MRLKSVFLPTDDRGKVVHAHGGQITFVDGWYYFIGEDRTDRNKVSCYRSKNLVDWIFCNNILTLDSPFQKHYVKTRPELEIEGEQAKIGTGCNIERPKVIYNELTKKYVMWMHWEKPADYSEARAAVAVCDTIDGDYTYLGSFNPIGHMSRDCTLFVDEDKAAYFISASRSNQDLHVYKLSEDYLSIDRHVRTLWPGQSREAPTMFKKDGTYYLLSSACTGWTPNQGAYAYSSSIDGDWTMLRDFGDETTYASQPTWVLPVQSAGGTVYLYVGDRWGGSGLDYFTSSYVVLPITVNEDKSIELNWVDTFDV